MWAPPHTQTRTHPPCTQPPPLPPHTQELAAHGEQWRGSALPQVLEGMGCSVERYRQLIRGRSGARAAPAARKPRRKKQQREGNAVAGAEGAGEEGAAAQEEGSDADAAAEAEG